MQVSPWFGLPAVLVLVVANGFFVATEFAIVAVRRSRLEQLARDGNLTARAAQDVVRHLDEYIAACQLGITMASLALGWIGEPVLAGLIEPPLEALVGQVAPAAAHVVAVGSAFALITALHIVIGELAPKGLALQRPEGVTLWVARPMQVFYVLFRWPITALNAVGNGVLRILGLGPSSTHEMVHSAEELILLLQASQRAGVVEESEARIARRAFHFADLTAADLRTPRTKVDAVPVTIGIDDLLEHAAVTSQSRLVVYEGSLDTVLGFVRVQDLVVPARRRGETVAVRSLLHPVLTVPESRHADDLLEDMRQSGRRLAVVVDEHGGTAGIVTLGDLMRALVGHIGEETAGPAPATFPRTEPDGSILVDGLMRLHEFEELLGEELHETEEMDVGTVSGLIMERLERLPQVGDDIEVAGRRLRVEALEGRRVAVARLGPALPVSG